MLDKVIFYFFAGTAVGSAALMVTRRNAVHSAIFLIATLAGDGGNLLAIARGIHFHRANHLVRRRDHGAVYFRDHACKPGRGPASDQFARQKWVALVVTLALTAQVGFVVLDDGKMPGQGFPILTAAPVNKLPPNAEAVAQSLFSSYLLPFELLRCCCWWR